MKPAKKTSIKVPKKFARTAGLAEAFEAGYVRGLADRLRSSIDDVAIGTLARGMVDRFGTLTGGALPIALPELAPEMARVLCEAPDPDEAEAIGREAGAKLAAELTCSKCGSGLDGRLTCAACDAEPSSSRHFGPNPPTHFPKHGGPPAPSSSPATTQTSAPPPPAPSSSPDTIGELARKIRARADAVSGSSTPGVDATSRVAAPVDLGFARVRELCSDPPTAEPSSSPPSEIGKCLGCGADMRFPRGDIGYYCAICHAAKPSDNSGYRKPSDPLPLHPPGPFPEGWPDTPLGRATRAAVLASEAARRSDAAFYDSPSGLAVRRFIDRERTPRGRILNLIHQLARAHEHAIAMRGPLGQLCGGPARDEKRRRRSPKGG